jgi:16S rRNA (guanine(527)-N(7))-methyltransferase RsmG
VSDNSPQTIPFFDTDSLLNKYDSGKRIESFLEEIISANRKINLVSRETSRLKLLQLAADCLVPLEFISTIEGKIFDIGPGAGFPSIVLMLAIPNLKATLVERTGKKTRFLESIAAKYDLGAIIINDDLSNTIKKMGSGSFEYGFMKYVRLDLKILKMALSLLKPAGRFIYFSDIDQKQFSLKIDFIVKKYAYYLDDNKRVRTLTLFSSNS